MNAVNDFEICQVAFRSAILSSTATGTQSRIVQSLLAQMEIRKKQNIISHSFQNLIFLTYRVREERRNQGTLEREQADDEIRFRKG